VVQPAISPDGKWIWDGNNWILANCQNCQSELNPNWNFCPNCSLSINNSKTCTRCSRPINDDWKTCPYCTSNLTTKSDSHQNNTIPKKQTISQKNGEDKESGNILLVVAILIVCFFLFRGQGIINISLYDWISVDCNAMAQGSDFNFDDDTWEITETESFDQGTYNDCQSKQIQAGFLLLVLAVLTFILGNRVFGSGQKKNNQMNNQKQKRDLFGKPITNDIELRVSNTESKETDTDWKDVFDNFCNLVKKKSPEYYDQERYNKLEQIIQNYHWGNATESDDRTDLFFTTVYHVNQILELAPPSFRSDFENSQYYSKYQSVLSNAKTLSLKQKSAYIVLIKKILKISKW